ncbi:MAG: Crp/Fnr family transcriptional regulator [Oscillospiraceae bacterium]|nr:Crp/Fnr family transcriptional regulator [Oscillospiraceae bacterium]
MFGEYLDILKNAPLFEGLKTAQIAALLAAAGARLEIKEAGESFIEQDEERPDIFVVLSGRAAGERLSVSGALSRINEFLPGSEFGDLLSGSRERSPVTVRALGRCAALRLSFDSLLSAQSAESERARVVRNLVAIASGKYFALTRRLELLTEPKLRRRIAALLLPLFEEQKADEISLPFDREGMAAYLGCERSALSRALAGMRRRGAISYKKNHFRLLDLDILNKELF